MNDFEALQRGDRRWTGRTVADIGCGDGAMVRKLGRRAPTRSASTSTSPRAQGSDPDGRYLQGGAQEIPLEDQSVDVAILLKSLHHVPDPHSAFPELHRVVRDRVFIAEPLPTGAFFELLRPVDDETQVRAHAQEAIAAAQGFEHVRTLELRDHVPARPTSSSSRTGSWPPTRHAPNASRSSNRSSAKRSRRAITRSRCAPTSWLGCRRRQREDNRLPVATGEERFGGGDALLDVDRHGSGADRLIERGEREARGAERPEGSGAHPELQR